MQASQTSEDFQGQVLSRLEAIDKDLSDLKTEIVVTNARVEAYQRAQGQVVNLAFGLIAAAAAGVIIPVVVGR
jgi:hypothetical protein